MMRFGRGCRVGLALGGGALRGLSHIGVLEALQQENVPVSVIAGTSMGAIVGAMYAVEPDVEALKERIQSYLGGDVFRQSGLDFLKPKEAEEGGGIFYKFSALIRKSVYYTLSLTRRSLISEETVRKNLACLLPDIEIGQTRLPFAATALDLREGREFVFTSGSLRLAVAASCALPGVIPPVELDGMVLVDGGWIDPVPVRPARRLGADMIIGVDVCGEVGESDIPTNGLDTMLRADTVTRYALGGETMRGADQLIRVDLVDIPWSDFARADDVIRRGRQTTLLHIEGIRKSVRRLKLRRLVGLG